LSWVPALSAWGRWAESLKPSPPLHSFHPILGYLPPSPAGFFPFSHQVPLIIRTDSGVLRVFFFHDNPLLRVHLYDRFPRIFGTLFFFAWGFFFGFLASEPFPFGSVLFFRGQACGFIPPRHFFFLFERKSSNFLYFDHFFREDPRLLFQRTLFRDLFCSPFVPPFNLLKMVSFFYLPPPLRLALLLKSSCQNFLPFYAVFPVRYTVSWELVTVGSGAVRFLCPPFSPFSPRNLGAFRSCFWFFTNDSNHSLVVLMTDLFAN